MCVCWGRGCGLDREIMLVFGVFSGSTSSVRVHRVLEQTS